MKNFFKLCKIILRCIVTDRLSTQRFSPGSSLASSDKRSVEEAVHYTQEVFEDYLCYGNLSLEKIKGLRVLELGPGEHLGVALLFAAYGAEKVVCLDKFRFLHEASFQQELYQFLRATLPSECLAAYDAALEGLQQAGGVIEAYFDAPMEAFPSELLEGKPFDLLLSRVVLEYSKLIEETFAQMDRVLKPGGMMLHKIDMRDDGLFTGEGLHPLTFLTIPSAMYRLMTGSSYRPNRWRAGHYKNLCDLYGYKSHVYVTILSGAEQQIIPHVLWADVEEEQKAAAFAVVQGISPRLAAEFKHRPSIDLAVSGLFLSALKE